MQRTQGKQKIIRKMDMNILVVGDIHNDVENIMSYSDKISQLSFDAIVCPGDFTDVGLRGFTPADIAKLVIAEQSFSKDRLLPFQEISTRKCCQCWKRRE